MGKQISFYVTPTEEDNIFEYCISLGLDFFLNKIYLNTNIERFSNVSDYKLVKSGLVQLYFIPKNLNIFTKKIIQQDCKRRIFYLVTTKWK